MDKDIFIFVKRLIKRESAVEVFFEQIRTDLYDYEDAVNQIILLLDIATRKEILFSDTSKESALDRYFFDLIKKTELSCKRIYHALETSYTIRKKDRDILIKLFEDADNIFGEKLEKWRSIETPEELIGDRGDEFYESEDKERFRKKIKFFNDHINKIINKKQTMTSVTMFLILIILSLPTIFDLMKYFFTSVA